jgi:hypothetical protein
MEYLVADAKDLAVAAIANHIVVRCLVDLDLDLTRVGDWDKRMVTVSRFGQRQASLTQVIVGALEAFVSHTNDRLQA